MADFYKFMIKQNSVYDDDICYIGQVQCDTLQLYWPKDKNLNQYESQYLDLVYTNQLFRCPRTSLWRGDPNIFSISTQIIQNLNGTYTLRVTVLNSITSEPVENASLCLWMRNESTPKYFVKLTNSSGIAEFNVGTGCNNATLTTSYEKYNYEPSQTNITLP
ncbi:MAG: hypothetical protein ACUVWP_07340 [bacterium]